MDFLLMRVTPDKIKYSLLSIIREIRFCLTEQNIILEVRVTCIVHTLFGP